MNINPKVTAATLGAACSIILAWALALVGVPLPGEAIGAFATLFSFAFGYLKAA